MITFYDYDNQAWVTNGRYQDCAHPFKAGMRMLDGYDTCGCFARKNHGKQISSEVLTRAYERGVINYNEMMEIISLRKKEAA